MPRGRHRHAQPLHRLLPPLTVTGCAVALAAASLLSGDPVVLRMITAAAALTAAAGAVLARAWDRSAGRRVAELTAARTRDEWRADERIAEAETDLEESREIRDRLERKLRAKRSELGRLRSEHAELLRRYATAESERARALEARRKLQLEGAAQQQLALTSGSAPMNRAAFERADRALRDLARNAARQQAQRTVEAARAREAAALDEPQGRHASGAPALPRAREHHLVPAVAPAAVLPYGQRPAAQPAAQRAIGGFDFFGTGKRPQPALPTPAAPAVSAPVSASAAVPGPAPQHDRPADDAAPAAPAAAADPEVIDLTAHDETELLDMSELRAQA